MIKSLSMQNKLLILFTDVIGLKNLVQLRRIAILVIYIRTMLISDGDENLHFKRVLTISSYQLDIKVYICYV